MAAAAAEAGVGAGGAVGDTAEGKPERFYS